MDNNKSDRSEVIEKAAVTSDIDRRIKELVRLLNAACGDDRSFSAYARAAGISAAAMSRIKKGDYIPSPATLKKLTSPAADPRGGVTYEELMSAAGYAVKDDLDTQSMEYGSPLSIMSRKNESYDRQRIGEVLRTYKKDLISQIYISLARKGIMFRVSEDNTERRISHRPDLFLEIADSPLNEWIFEFMYWHSDNRGPSAMMIWLSIAQALRMEMKKNTKYSMVVNSKRIFDMLKRYKHGLAFRGELSVIYYDSEKQSFVDEYYLSNYYEEDYNREIYII